MERSSSSTLLSTPPTSSPGPSSSNALSGPSRTPYRPGFQPKGVSRSRTEEFVVVRLGREERREGRRGEEKRLVRRLDKIIALHFTPRSVLDEREVKKSKTAVEGERRRKEERLKGHHRRESSLVDDLLVEGKSPRDVWKSWKERSFSGSNNNLNALSENGDEKGKGKMTAEQKRAVEQSIVKWEDDSSAKACSVCQTPFSFLMRRHHCRLCGLLTCSLPPTPPHLIPLTNPAKVRKETCSVLFVADWRDGRCELVPEGFKGFLKVGEMGGGTKQLDEEMQVEGVRSCRRCWEIVEKKQYMLEAARVPAFTRMYEALTTIQAEIEEMIPDYRELVKLCQTDGSTTSDERAMVDLRRTLLESFSTYDALAKRLRGLPCTKGSAQEKVQIGVGIRAGSWLAKEMGAVEKSLARQKKKHAKNASLAPSLAPSTAGASEDGSSVGPVDTTDSDLAMQIQPLLEQEAQLESFIKEAESRRKFDDAQSLQLSLEEIRKEISRIAAGAV